LSNRVLYQGRYYDVLNIWGNFVLLTDAITGQGIFVPLAEFTVSQRTLEVPAE